jgi:DNA-binding beta-propeller fold protein YncE
VAVCRPDPERDRSHIGVLIGGVTPTEVYLDTAATNTVSAETYIGPYVAAIALNHTGSQLLAGPYLLDDGMHLEGTIDAARGLAQTFAASGATAYSDEDDHVDVIDTSRQLETATVAPPEPRAQFSEAVGVSPDGSALVAQVCGGPLDSIVVDQVGHAFARSRWPTTAWPW